MSTLYFISDNLSEDPKEIKQNVVVFSTPLLSSQPPNQLGLTKINSYDVIYSVTNGFINYNIETLSIPYYGGGHFKILGKLYWSSAHNYETWWHYLIDRVSNAPQSVQKTHILPTPIPLINSAELVLKTEPNIYTVEVDPVSSTLISKSPIIFGNYFYTNQNLNYSKTIMFEVQQQNEVDLSQFYITRIYEPNYLTLSAWDGTSHNILVYGTVSNSNEYPRLSVDEIPYYQTIYNPTYPVIEHPAYQHIANLKGLYHHYTPLSGLYGNTLGINSIWEWEINNGLFRVFAGAFYRANLRDTIVSFTWPLNETTVVKNSTFPSTNAPNFSNQDSDENGRAKYRYDFFNTGYLQQWSTNSQGILSLVSKTHNVISLAEVDVYYTGTTTDWKNDSPTPGGYVYTTIAESNILSVPLLFETGLYDTFDYLIGTLDKKGYAFKTDELGSITIYKDAIYIDVITFYDQTLLKYIPYLFASKNQILTTIQNLLKTNEAKVYISPTLSEQTKPTNGSGTIAHYWLEGIEGPPITFTIINGTFTTFTAIPESSYYTNGPFANGSIMYDNTPAKVLNENGIIGTIRWVTDSFGMLTIVSVTQGFDTNNTTIYYTGNLSNGNYVYDSQGAPLETSGTNSNQQAWTSDSSGYVTIGN